MDRNLLVLAVSAFGTAIVLVIILVVATINLAPTSPPTSGSTTTAQAVAAATTGLLKFKDSAGIAKDLATVAAIVVGGFWSYMLFVRKRQKYPRAKITHEISHSLIADSKLLLHIVATISNTGDVLLSIIYAETRVQQMLPVLPELSDSIQRGNDPVVEGRTEIDWPQLASREIRRERGQFEIEPGESDEIHYDFILDVNVQTIKIYSYFENIAKPGKKIGWPLITVYDIHERAHLEEKMQPSQPQTDRKSPDPDLDTKQQPQAPKPPDPPPPPPPKPEHK